MSWLLDSYIKWDTIPWPLQFKGFEFHSRLFYNHQVKPSYNLEQEILSTTINASISALLSKGLQSHPAIFADLLLTLVSLLLCSRPSHLRKGYDSKNWSNQGRKRITTENNAINATTLLQTNLRLFPVEPLPWKAEVTTEESNVSSCTIKSGLHMSPFQGFFFAPSSSTTIVTIYI